MTVGSLSCNNLLYIQKNMRVVQFLLAILFTQLVSLHGFAFSTTSKTTTIRSTTTTPSLLLLTKSKSSRNDDRLFSNRIDAGTGIDTADTADTADNADNTDNAAATSFLEGMNATSTVLLSSSEIQTGTSSTTFLTTTTTTTTITTILNLWKRRLITNEDPLSIHKLAAIGYTLSSAILLFNAAIRLSTSPELFSIIPSQFEIVMNIFTISNIIMCGASVRMAFIHRQGDLTARNAFLGTAVSSLFSGFYMVWISPFVEGDVFNSLWISRSCFAILVGLNGYFILDTILQTDEIVEGRRDRKAQDYEYRKVIDTLGYVFPVAWGAPLILATGFISCILHDRSWFLDQCAFIDEQMTFPGMQSHIFYQQLSTSLAASYASLFVTLRDKKLITKVQELTGITVFAMPALIWSIYTTVVFTKYLFVPH